MEKYSVLYERKTNKAFKTGINSLFLESSSHSTFRRSQYLRREISRTLCSPLLDPPTRQEKFPLLLLAWFMTSIADGTLWHTALSGSLGSVQVPWDDFLLLPFPAWWGVFLMLNCKTRIILRTAKWSFM